MHLMCTQCTKVRLKPRPPSHVQSTLKRVTNTSLLRLAHKRRNRRSSFGASAKSAGTSSTKPTDERSPLLPTRAPPGVPARPARLQHSVSDPALRNVAQGQYLVPTTSSSTPDPSRPRTRRAKSSQSLKRGGKKAGPRLDKGYYGDPLWLLGLALMVLGEFGNFLSYSFAPASLVAPLGSVALVANVGLAPLIVKEVCLSSPRQVSHVELTPRGKSLAGSVSPFDDAISSAASWHSVAAP